MYVACVYNCWCWGSRWWTGESAHSWRLFSAAPTEIKPQPLPPLSHTILILSQPLPTTGWPGIRLTSSGLELITYSGSLLTFLQLTDYAILSGLVLCLSLWLTQSYITVNIMSSYSRVKFLVCREYIVWLEEQCSSTENNCLSCQTPSPKSFTDINCTHRQQLTKQPK